MLILKVYLIWTGKCLLRKAKEEEGNWMWCLLRRALKLDTTLSRFILFFICRNIFSLSFSYFVYLDCFGHSTSGGLGLRLTLTHQRFCFGHSTSGGLGLTLTNCWSSSCNLFLCSKMFRRIAAALPGMETKDRGDVGEGICLWNLLSSILVFSIWYLISDQFCD